MTTPELRRKHARRAWWAIGVGTLLQVVSYGSLLLAILAAAGDSPEAAGPAYALGFAMVPLVFVAVAFISSHPRAPMAALKAMGIWILVALPVGLFNPVTGLCTGFAAGGAVAMRQVDDHQRGARAMAVVFAAIYATILVLTNVQAGIFAGGVTPLLAIKSADVYSQRRRQPEEEED